jgi:tRNA(Ile)-lysidine synthase
MAISKKSRRSDLRKRVAEVLLTHVKPQDRAVIGLSGGLDSVVLFDIVATLAGLDAFQLSAVHVNHQISPNASTWAQFVVKLCDERGIPCNVVIVDVNRGCGSVESAARYRAFAQQKADVLLLAHHLDDQIETMMLRLLRGAGVKGLSAMQQGRSDAFDAQSNYKILRPMLSATRHEIEDYAAERGLHWIEDESNSDTRYDRNFLRWRIFPELEKQFPEYREILFRANEHLTEAATLLEDLAQIDIGNIDTQTPLSIELLRGLSSARAKNVLRYYLAQHNISYPSAARLEETLRQLLSARGDAQLRVCLGAWELRRFKSNIWLVKKPSQLKLPLRVQWQGQRHIDLDALGGAISLQETHGCGISLAKLKQAEVTIRLRTPGLKIRPDVNRPRRTLKNLLQEAALPPWMRDRLPLMFCAETLVWVPNIGVACDFQAQADELGVTPLWTPN